MYSVDIDTGGTMTDCLVSGKGELCAIKVDTTPHDFTVSFRDCLTEASRQLGYDDVPAFLGDVDIMRWSSTITTNVLGERRGSKVGLLVSKGHKSDLYGEGRSLLLEAGLVKDEHVVEISAKPGAEEVLGAVRGLLGDGVRRICVCLQGSYPDNQAEREIKRIIEERYPDHVIGAVPVLLGSEMAQVGDDATRVSYSTINAYVHTHLAQSLFKAEDILRYEEGWSGPLLIGHTNGGVARIGKTKAVDTIESGPAFGTFGGAFFAQRYGLENILCFDVGGTTTKASVARKGAPLFQRGGELVGVPVKTSIPMLRSAVIGGGSVARPDGSGGVSLGPESMGASPGPACYALGGTEVTLTDALVVLGYLDPVRFLDGRRQLDVERSRKALEKRLGKPLGVSIEAAAQMVRDQAVEIMADLVQSTLREAGLDPKDVALFAYGGNGPLFAALVAERLSMPSAYTFALSPVFSAFGSAIADVVHVYERGLGLDLGGPVNAERVAGELRKLMATAQRDLDGEGFSSGQARFEIEAEIADGATPLTTVRLEDVTEAGGVAGTMLKAYRDAVPQGRGAQVMVETARLISRYQVGAYEPVKKAPSLTAAAAPASGERQMIFSGAPLSAATYRWEDLAAGNAVPGPAVVAGGSLTCLVPPGWKMVHDEYGNGLLHRE